VVIVLEDDRPASVLAVNGRSDIRPEAERAQIIPIGVESHEMPLRVVVTGVGAKQNASIRSDNGRRRRTISHRTVTGSIRRRIDSEGGAVTTAAGRTVGRQPAPV